MLHLSQGQLARLSGVGINSLMKMERGEANPTLGVLSRVLDTLGMELTCTLKEVNNEAGTGI